MPLFIKYLRGHLGLILTYFLFCAIFAIVFALYHLPLGAVLYPALLCLILAVFLAAADYLRQRRRHRQLERIAGLSAAMMGEIPVTGSIDAEDYAAIISALQTELRTMETRYGEKYEDMVEYYTMWAHQIKTPIASMQLTLQNTDSRDARRLRAELLRIEQYVEMVLAFLRLDSQSSDYVFREQPLDPIIRHAVRRFSAEFIGRGIALHYEPVNISLVTDDKWLAFVLEQLISNALKYTREGSVKIYLKEPLTLCIEDTGIGIAPEDLPRVFEKGYTGCNGRSDKKASGIGLYLCRRVCDNLGIAIAAQSEQGRGTTVTLDLKQHEVRRD